VRRLALLAAWLLAAGPAAAADTVTDRVFGANLLSGITAPATLRYHYEMRGTTLKEPFGSHVAMDVREVAQDGGKKVWVDMFEGPNRRALGPIDAREQNPLVLVFLQRDVAQMGGLTGGAGGYFQQQIRRAFGKPAEVSALEVDVAGQPVQATRVVIHPFRDDPAIERFPRFRDKAYEFVVAPGVPGGLYRIAASTPDSEGNTVLEESMTFDTIDRPAAAGQGTP
jgi:hypothetical protein